MNKFLTIVVAVLCYCSVFAQSEEQAEKRYEEQPEEQLEVTDGTDVTDTKEVADSTKNKKPDYKFHKNFSHWSIAVSGGFDILLTERDQPYGEEIHNYHDDFLGEANVDVKYSVNPRWGVALGYSYAPIAKNCIYPQEQYDVHPEKNGQGHQVYAMVDVNLLNLFRRYRKHTEWGWYLGIGVGAYFFNTSDEFIATGEEKWTATAFFPVASHVDYSPIQDLSIFMKTSLDLYLCDKINVHHKAALNDWNLYGGIGIRWNIIDHKKPHVHVTDMNTYENVKIPAKVDTAKIKKLEDQIKDLQGQLDSLKNQPTAPNEPNDDIEELIRQAQKNAKEIEDLRNRLNSQPERVARPSMEYNSVYFAHNSWEITEKYRMIIDDIAHKMLTYPDLKLEIAAFCSKVGTTKQNNIVGENRIEAVMAVLMENYNINPQRISSHYDGQVFTGNESDNRRCDLKLK